MTDQPKRRRKDRSAQSLTDWLPAANPRAKWAYLLAFWSLIPPLGVIAGPAAIALGASGIRAARRNPEIEGVNHAGLALILGTLCAVTQLMGCYFIAVGMGWL